jgi:hypothetical protein
MVDPRILEGSKVNVSSISSGGAAGAAAASSYTLQAAALSFALNDQSLGGGVGKATTQASSVLKLLQQLSPNLGGNVDVRA